jgi:hypothetical protein
MNDMQRLAQSLALLAAFAGTTAAQAASENPAAPRRVLSAAVYNVQGNVPGRFNVGVVNVSRSKITLNLPRAYHCPPGRMCAMVMPAPLNIDLPLVSAEQGSCGERIYVAQRDSRPVDGALQTITVTDHSRSTCELVLNANTTVAYDVESLRGDAHTLSMTATKLSRGRADYVQSDVRYDCRRTPHIADLGLNLRISDLTLVRGEKTRKAGSLATLSESGLMGIMSTQTIEVREESRPGALSFSDAFLGRLTLNMPVIRDPIEDRPATLNAQTGEVTVENQDMLCRTY